MTHDPALPELYDNRLLDAQTHENTLSKTDETNKLRAVESRILGEKL